MDIRKVVMVVSNSHVRHTACFGRLFIYGIDTCHIQSNRVKRGEHANIKDNRHVIFIVAVTVWGYINHKADMEIWSVNNPVPLALSFYELFLVLLFFTLK